MQHVSSMYDDVLSKAEIDRVKGFAKFRDAHTIVVHDAAGDIVSTMTAANILVATGSEPKLAEFPGSELAITSDQALSMERRPQRVAVVGAGPLGVEFASIYAGLGASVDIFFRKALPLTGVSCLQLSSSAPSPLSLAILHSSTVKMQARTLILTRIAHISFFGFSLVQ